jgi:putative spermidine/putrescine transport system permease protein
MVEEEHPRQMTSEAGLMAEISDRVRRQPDSVPVGLATLLLGPATAVVAVAMVIPLIAFARYGFNSYDRIELMKQAWDIGNYVRFFSDPFFLGVLLRTIGMAFLATVLCLAIGFPIAFQLVRTQSRFKSIAVFLIVLPLFISGTIRCVGWMIVLARGSLLDTVIVTVSGARIDLMHTTLAVLFGIASFNLPYLILTLQSAIEGVDMELQQAAEGLGATPQRAFWRVIWPLAFPGVVVAAILSFVLAMNAYAAPVLLGGPRFQMMAPLLYWEFGTQNNWPMASVVAFVIMGTTLLLVGIASALLLRRR